MLPKTLHTVIGAGQSLDTVKAAISLCESDGCHLAVTVIGIAPPPPGVVYGVMPNEAWAKERDTGQRQAQAQAEAVSALLAAAQVSGDVAHYYCDEGQAAAFAGLRARYADLSLLQTGDQMDELVFDRALQGQLFESARPVLAVPGAAVPVLRAREVLIAWNASAEATRAVHCALDMLREADTVHIAMIDPVASESQQGEEPGSDLAAYLARHGMNVSVEVLASGSRNQGEVILQHATDIGAGMIVMGGYGHSRLREYIFGGVTKYLLDHATMPLLMAH
ncbi:MAG: universal stress protein [Brucellaceae bacterium]|nr:universal stress protein [Brucellaceae bacterium]